VDAERWIARFEANRNHRPEPDWSAPIALSPEQIPALRSSLEQFHLGDGGGPASLIAWNAAAFRQSAPLMDRLVDLWFAEEKEHSRLLGAAVERFGGRPISGHWSFTAFCLSRRLFGVGFELTVLLLTEISSTAYYRLLRRHGNDPALRAMCGLILRDEGAHIALHCDRLAGTESRSAHGMLWEARFRALGLAAATMLWVNHGRCLRSLGATNREFYREVWREMTRFVGRLRRLSCGHVGGAPFRATGYVRPARGQG
jgi:hypothetical protein